MMVMEKCFMLLKMAMHVRFLIPSFVITGRNASVQPSVNDLAAVMRKGWFS